MMSMNHKLIASGTNGTVQVFLDRWDYEDYVVSIHYGNGTVRESFENMTRACQKFFESCRENGIEPKKAF